MHTKMLPLVLIVCYHNFNDILVIATNLVLEK